MSNPKPSFEKYGPQAEDWSEEAYADAQAYLAHRAALIAALGPPLGPGDTVLDLACGDGGRPSDLFCHADRHRGFFASFRDDRN